MHPSVALLLTAVMVLANAFFVASEFAFVKIRPTRLQQLAREGRVRARAAARDHAAASGVPVGQPARDHAGVADARLAGGAGVRAVDPAPARAASASARATVHTLAAAISLTSSPSCTRCSASWRPRRSHPAHRIDRDVGGGAVPRLLPGIVPGHLDAQGGGRAGAADPAPAARVGGGDAALARRAAPGHPARAAGSGRAAPHRPGVRLHPPRRAPRDDVAARRRHADGRASRSTTTCGSRSRTSTRATRWSSRGPIASSATSTSRTSSARWRRASGPQFMRELVREPIYASDDTRLEWLRREFQRRRVHIAIILGPGHTFAGIVTLEDLLEEVRRRDPGRAGRRGDPAHRRATPTAASRSTGG